LPSSGQVQLFDPIYCATGDNGHGGSFGAGDHWTSPTSADVGAPVSVTYRLYNTQGTLLDVTDDGNPVATLTYDPGGAKLADLSGRFGVVGATGLKAPGLTSGSRWLLA
jgi:YD repeat-containing protein